MRPPDTARLVARGRPIAALIWLWLGSLGAIVAYFGGLSASLAIEIPFLALALVGLSSIAFSRVWIDGRTLYVRHIHSYKPPIRLDALERAELTEINRAAGRALWLTASDGTRTRLDATNMRLKPLYAELALHIPAGSPVANGLLHRRMKAARPAIAVPPSSASTESSWTT